jgi:hypothetical protein
VSPPTTTTTPPPHEDVVDSWLQKHPILGAVPNLFAGIGAGAEQSVAGLDKLGRKIIPGAEGEDWLTKEAAKPTHGIVQSVGKGAEAVGEYFTGEELLGMLGKAGAALPVAERLKTAQQLADTIRKVPYVGKALAIGMHAVKSGAIAGGQEYVKTGGDVGQASQTGKTQAEFTAALEVALPPAMRWAAKPVASYLERIAPKMASILGEQSPVLASQMGPTGRIVESAEVPRPEMQAKQQAFNAGVVRTYAQNAYRSVVNSINAAAQDASRSSPWGGRALPAPEAAPVEPTTFSIDVPTVERPIGNVQRAQPFPRTATSGVPGMEPAPETTKALGSTAKTIPERAQMRARPAYMTSGAPGEAEQISENVATPSTATMSTQDPLEAMVWKQHAEQVMNSPEWKEMSSAEKQAYTDLHKNISDQLNMHYTKTAPPPGYGGHMPLIDPEQGLHYIQTPGMAAEAIQAQLQPGYNELDRISKGGFSTLRDQVQKAKAALSNPAITGEARNAAEKSFDEATNGIGKMIDDASDSPMIQPYYAAMKRGFADSKFLEKLDAFQEASHNGYTIQNTAQGFPRMMRGNLKGLESFLSDGNNRATLNRLLGPEAEGHLKEMHAMLNNAQFNRASQDVVRNVAEEANQTIGRGMGRGGLAGAIFGHWHLGAALGTGVGVANFTGRQIMRQAMNDSRLGQLISYAAKNDVSPKIYAPLIARTMLEGSKAMTTKAPEQKLSPEEQKAMDELLGQQDNTESTPGESPPQTMVTPNPKGLIEAGNLDIRNRPIVENADGTHSSEYSISIGDDKGREVLIPTVVNGKFLTPNGKKPPEGSAAEKQMFRRAEDHYHETGEHLGIFDSPDDADAYAQILHSRPQPGVKQ